MLKKLHTFILPSALCLVLLSCTKHGAGSGVDGLEWTEDLSAPVPVEFYVSDDATLSTKAAPVKDISYFSEHNFGIIAYSNELKDNNVLIRGRARTSADGQAYFVDTFGVRQKLCYPFQSSKSYTFYAYYTGDDTAYENTGMLGEDYGMVIADYGKVDVLYGSSVATPVYVGGERIDGFNASYFRTLSSLGLYGREYLPNIALKHLCTMINFHFSYENGTDPDAQVYISRVTAGGINYSGHLYFSTGRIETYTRGKIQYMTGQWVGRDRVNIPEVNFYLSPEDLDELYFDISVNYSDKVSPLTATISAAQIRQVLNDNGVDSFKAGSCYSFDVTLRKEGYIYVTELEAHRTN